MVCDGFYEWQRGEGGKQPYLVYRRPESGKPSVEELQEYDDRSHAETKDWEGPSLLYMAGLYSTWTGPDGVPVYNYTILTRESSPLLNWLHHRMPCFLRPSDLTPWLTSPSFSSALSLLSLPTEEDISWHPVSRDVGNVRNQDLNLVKRVEAVQVNKKKTSVSSASKSLMSNWLKRTRQEAADNEEGSGDGNKKIK